MRRWVPYPVLAVGLLLMWLMLTQSISPGQILLGGIVSLLAVHAMAALESESSRVRSVSAALKLAALVVIDIVRSNFAVASLVLFPRHDRVANFLRLPLDLTNPHGLALLSLIITSTPGTIWVEFDRGRGSLLIHVLDVVDEEHWTHLIKGRYEKLLLEIFGS